MTGKNIEIIHLIWRILNYYATKAKCSSDIRILIKQLEFIWNKKYNNSISRLSYFAALLTISRGNNFNYDIYDLPEDNLDDMTFYNHFPTSDRWGNDRVLPMTTRRLLHIPPYSLDREVARGKSSINTIQWLHSQIAHAGEKYGYTPPDTHKWTKEEISKSHGAPRNYVLEKTTHMQFVFANSFELENIGDITDGEKYADLARKWYLSVEKYHGWQTAKPSRLIKMNHITCANFTKSPEEIKFDGYILDCCLGDFDELVKDKLRVNISNKAPAFFCDFHYAGNKYKTFIRGPLDEFNSTQVMIDELKECFGLNKIGICMFKMQINREREPKWYHICRDLGPGLPYKTDTRGKRVDAEHLEVIKLSKYLRNNDLPEPQMVNYYKILMFRKIFNVSNSNNSNILINKLTGELYSIDEGEIMPRFFIKLHSTTLLGSLKFRLKKDPIVHLDVETNREKIEEIIKKYHPNPAQYILDINKHAKSLEKATAEELWK
jgi:hypothetical protein